MKAEWLPSQKVAEGMQEACGTMRHTEQTPSQKAAPHLGYNGIKPCLTPGIVPRVGVQHPAPIREMRQTGLGGVAGLCLIALRGEGEGLVMDTALSELKTH